jgi:hypothetical protein
MVGWDAMMRLMSVLISESDEGGVVGTVVEEQTDAGTEERLRDGRAGTSRGGSCKVRRDLRNARLTLMEDKGSRFNSVFLLK